MQRSETEQFLYETTVAASVKETVTQLAELHNLRAKIQVLPNCIRIALYRPWLPLSWPSCYAGTGRQSSTLAQAVDVVVNAAAAAAAAVT